MFNPGKGCNAGNIPVNYKLAHSEPTSLSFSCYNFKSFPDYLMTSVLPKQNAMVLDAPVDQVKSTKPQPKCMDEHLGNSARVRKPNIFKLFYKFSKIPGVYQLSEGLPNKKFFPVAEVNASTVNFDKYTKHNEAHDSIVAKGELIESTLQYGQAGGHPELAEWIQNYVDRSFDCPYEGGFATIMSSGNTDAINKIWQVFSNEWRPELPVELREGIITEEFTYSLAAECARVRGLNISSVAMDDQGVLPEALEDLLANWDFSKGKRPHLMYTISIGQNPTGATCGIERRKQIYKICQKYDIIIVEDEPYWFLQFDGVFENCYLKIDVDGRVIRLDSFSKNFAPGSRLGYIIAQPKIIRHLWNIAEEATQQPSGFSQMIMLETLKKWGFDGWNSWLGGLRNEYQDRRDLMVDALTPYKYINDNLVLDFKKPAAGMFVWVKVQYDNHPLADKFSHLEMSRAFWTMNATNSQPVLVTPGYFFAPSLVDAEHMAPYIRLSYANAEKTNISKWTDGFGRNSIDFWNITDPEQMRQLAADFPEA